MPSTTAYRRGDLVLLAFPFAGAAVAKARPAMVVADTGDADLVVARVTTQLHAASWDHEIAVWRAAGLLAPSAVRLHKLATLERRLVQRPLGRLTDGDLRRVSAIL